MGTLAVELMNSTPCSDNIRRPAAAEDQQGPRFGVSFKHSAKPGSKIGKVEQAAPDFVDAGFHRRRIRLFPVGYRIVTEANHVLTILIPAHRASKGFPHFLPRWRFGLVK